jgi:two-component system sensor histidine kinase YesM
MNTKINLRIGSAELIKNWYLNLSIKYKILIFFYSIVFLVSLSFGIYSTSTSEKYVINKVSSANLNVVKQLSSNLSLIQKDIVDISTYLCIDSDIQASLNEDNKLKKPVSNGNLPYKSNSINFIINIIASKSYISCLFLYSNNDSPYYYEFTDMSTGVKAQSVIRNSSVYKTAVNLKGAPFWFPMLEQNNTFIQNSNYPKIGVCRIIKDFATFKQNGFLVIGLNESVIGNMCKNNIQNGKEGIIIADAAGNIISHVGTNFYGEDYRKKKYFLQAQNNKEGSIVDSINGKDFLISYSTVGEDWKAIYAVPMDIIKNEINSVKTYTIFIVFISLLFSFPLILLTSSLLTSPIKKLLKSMKHFQLGNFDEKVQFLYNDEIGQLGKGYNNMVISIKELIDKAYVLQIKEREAELNALQAQINPHFLYNTLDTIFWKAESNKDQEVSEMVYSLSKLFRLSLNRGSGTTLVSREKELIEHYLLLQKIRFKNNLSYDINIEPGILNHTIPKLILQPFVENSILHGIEGKENGGTVCISGKLETTLLKFTIEDDGIGMTEEKLQNLLYPDNGKAQEVSESSGGYAIRNVMERLELNYGDKFSLDIASTPGKGTKVEFLIPATLCSKDEEDKNA